MKPGAGAVVVIFPSHLRRCCSLPMTNKAGANATTLYTQPRQHLHQGELQLPALRRSHRYVYDQSLGREQHAGARIARHTEAREYLAVRAEHHIRHPPQIVLTAGCAPCSLTSSTCRQGRYSSHLAGGDGTDAEDAAGRYSRGLMRILYQMLCTASRHVACIKKGRGRVVAYGKCTTCVDQVWDVVSPWGQTMLLPHVSTMLVVNCQFVQSS